MTAALTYSLDPGIISALKVILLRSLLKMGNYMTMSEMLLIKLLQAENPGIVTNS